VDKKVKLRLTNNKITISLFYLIFKPIKGDVALLEDAKTRENKKVYKAVVS
jgi:hypothetical protein